MCNPKTSEVGTDLRAVRPRGTVPVGLSVERACQGEWRLSVLFVEAALSEKSPYPMSGAELGLSGLLG